MKDDALPYLDFNDFETCVYCVRGKFTKTKRKGSTRSKDLLEIIHTDISGPLTPFIVWESVFYHFYRRLFSSWICLPC